MVVHRPFNTIMNVVRLHRGVTELDLKSSSRRDQLIWPRFEVCWLAHKLTNMSLPHIGRSLGGRDHTTVINAVKRVDRAIGDNPEYAAEVSELRSICEKSMMQLSRVALPPRQELSAHDVAQRILAMGNGDFSWNLAEVRVLAQSYLDNRALLERRHAIARQIATDLDKLI